MNANRIAVAALTMCSLGANAGSQTGTVTQIDVRSTDGLVYVYLSGTPTSRADCAKAPYWMIKDENSTAGKQQLAQLSLAFATGKTVTLTGTGATGTGASGPCSRWSDGEDIGAVAVSN